MRRIDTTTGHTDIVPVPCGSTRQDQCQPCAEKARRLRMTQCREGWHLDTEPITDRATPRAEHKALMAARVDLLTAYTECKTTGDELTCKQIIESVTELDAQLSAAGVRGRLAPARSTTQAGQTINPVPSRCPGSTSPTSGQTDSGAGIRRALSALHVPHPHPRLLRARRQQGSSGGPRSL
jgi:Replication initiator protein, pSAM2